MKITNQTSTNETYYFRTGEKTKEIEDQTELKRKFTMEDRSQEMTENAPNVKIWKTKRLRDMENSRDNSI